MSSRVGGFPRTSFFKAESAKADKPENKNSIRGKIKNCLNSLKKPETFIWAGAAVMAAGATVAGASLIAPPSAPVLFPVGLGIAGVGLAISGIGFAMRAYQSRNKPPSDDTNKQQKVETPPAKPKEAKEAKGATNKYSAQNKDGSLQHLPGMKNVAYAKAIEPIRSPQSVQRKPSGGAFSLDHVFVDGRNITHADQDVVVNAANRQLRGGGGIDKAIHQKAGGTLLKELEKRYPQDSSGNACAFAEACATHSHGFASQGVSHLVHVTGPIVPQGQNPDDYKTTLQDAYTNALEKAVSLGARSVSLPILSSGVYGYPMALACEHALEICGKSEYQHLEISFYTWKDGPFGSGAFDTMSTTLNQMNN